jgi:hypothetical protein
MTREENENTIGQAECKRWKPDTVQAIYHQATGKNEEEKNRNEDQILQFCDDSSGARSS